METIAFSKSLTITNMDQLAKGTGARYLEVLPDIFNLPPNRQPMRTQYIALKWRRTVPASTKANAGHMLIDFKPEQPGEAATELLDTWLATPAPKKAKTRKVAGNTISKSAKVQPASVAKRESLLDCQGCRQPLSKRVAGRGFTKCLSCRKASK
jgi:hypothetical protein